MQLNMHRAKGCRASTRSGKLCQSPTMANGSLRVRGAGRARLTSAEFLFTGPYPGMS